MTAAVMVLTDRRQARRPLPEVVAAVVAGGAQLVVLREKDLPRADRAALAAELRAAAAPALLIVAGPDPLGGTAVHLAAGAAGPLPGVCRVGRSCHTRDEVLAAGGAAYVTVSPVFVSASKPGYGPPLGPAGLAALVRACAVPVFALGGVQTPVRAAACAATGAAGVAVMGAAMRAADPAALIAEMLTAMNPEVHP